MFEEYSEYEKEKVRLFLKYLAYASRRHIKKEQRRHKIEHEFVSKSYPSEPVLDISYKDLIKERLQEIDETRREELDNKIEMHYANNKFLPYENRLKRLKARFYRMKKNKNQSKEKINNLKTKIIKCEELLKRLKKLQISSH
jgi:hypothetical protein